jgi:hypothetical protein
MNTFIRYSNYVLRRSSFFQPSSFKFCFRYPSCASIEDYGVHAVESFGTAPCAVAFVPGSQSFLGTAVFQLKYENFHVTSISRAVVSMGCSGSPVTLFCLKVAQTAEKHLHVFFTFAFVNIFWETAIDPPAHQSLWIATGARL